MRDRLAASRMAVMDAIAGMDDQAFRAGPAEGEWSVAHILAHLFIVETMLLSRRPPFEDSERENPEAALVRRMTVPQLIHGLVAKRRENLSKLVAAERQGLVTAATMESFAQHEEGHAGQVTQVRAKLLSLEPAGASRA